MNPPNTQYFEAVSVDAELPKKGVRVTCLLSKNIGSIEFPPIEKANLYRMKHNGKWNDYDSLVTHWLKPISIVSEVSEDDIQNQAHELYSTRFSERLTYVYGASWMRSRLAPTIAVLNNKVERLEELHLLAVKLYNESDDKLISTTQQLTAEKEKSREQLAKFLQWCFTGKHQHDMIQAWLNGVEECDEYTIVNSFLNPTHP